MTLLIWTRTDDITADVVILELERRGVPFIRLNEDELPTHVRLAISGGEHLSGWIQTRRKRVALETIERVWFRRRDNRKNDGLATSEVFARSECRAALDWLVQSLDVDWIDAPGNVEKASGKLQQHLLARKLGFRSPPLTITNDLGAARQFISENGPCVAKALSLKQIDMESGGRFIPTRQVASEQLNEQAVSAAPLIVQQRVAKKWDVRVTVCGQRSFATVIDASRVEGARIDWRLAPIENLPHSAVDLPADVASFCQKTLTHWGLKFGAFDFVVDPFDHWHFIELNPVGQWAWIEPLTGQPIRNAMVDLLVDGC